MTDETTGLARSVQTRIVRHAKELGVDPNLVLTRFALERFLYRLSCSPHAERFVLKGALLMLAWFGESLRPTRDADLLGFGDLTDQSLTRIFQSIATTEVPPDGMRYEPSSIRVSAIRPEDVYGGTRVTLTGRVGSAKLRVQVDVGTGDIVTPEPEWLDYPTLLDFPEPRLRSYHPETVIAEKVHAIVVLGAKNSRMRDFFDLYVLSRRRAFEGRALSGAVRATFARRRTSIPSAIPFGFTAEFAESKDKTLQWAGFLQKNNLTSPEFPVVVAALNQFLTPLLDALSSDRPFAANWPPEGPWA